MKGLLILDKDAKTALSEDLKQRLLSTLEGLGHRVDVYELGQHDAASCIGCLLCFTKHPGECVSKDIVNELRKKVKEYSATIFLSPVIFGHYSATMSSPINKGAGAHELQVLIGYGEDITEEEKSTFIDLTVKHRGKADVVHPDMDEQVDAYVSECIQDNERICRAIAGYDGVRQ